MIFRGEVGGQVFLDRAHTAGFLETARLRDALVKFGIFVLRWPTTGHDNLPRMYWDAPIHTYGAEDGQPVQNPDYPNIHGELGWIAGNAWDPRHDLDNDVAPISQIATIQPLCAMVRAVALQLGRPVNLHVFFSWKRRQSEGKLNPFTGVGYDWYRDPYAKSIDDQPIDPSALASMKAIDFVNLENRRFARHLIEVEGMPLNMIWNMGGEDWRGEDEPNPPYAPNGEDDPGQDRKFQYLADQAAAALGDLRAYTQAKGWTGIRYCTGFLESVEGGTRIPLNPAAIDRDLVHFRMMLRATGAMVALMGCSMHYRRTWPEFLTDDEMQFAWFIPAGWSAGGAGQGSVREIRTYFKSLIADEIALHPELNINPDIELVPFANSVGDTKLVAEDTILTEADGDLLVDEMANFICTVLAEADAVPTQEERGLMAAQYQMELAAAGYSAAMAFNGFWGDNSSGDAGHQGVAGKVDPDPWGENPQYYPLMMLNTYAGNREMVPFTSDEARLPTTIVRCGAASSLRLRIFMMNKLDTPRTVNIDLSTTAITVRTVQRYSFTEIDAPVIDPSSVISIAGSRVTASLPEFSFTYVELGTPVNIPVNQEITVPICAPREIVTATLH